MTDFTAYLRLGVDSRDAVSAQRDLDRMAAAGGRADRSFNQLSGTSKLLGSSIGGIGLAAATAQVINYADAWTNVENVLIGVSDSSAAYAVTQAKVLSLSKDTFSSLQGTASLYSEITRSVSELGINQDRIIGVTRTINNLFLAGGKAASETAGAVRQLSQGLASGALRGDEFNSVAEGAPRILDALSKSLNISKGGLREFAATGGITSQILIESLESYSEEAQKAVDTTKRTFSQSSELARTFALEFVGASDSIEAFSANAGTALVTVAQNLDIVSDAVTVLAVAYGGRLAGSLATAAAAKASSIAVARALAIAENDAAVGIARRATVEAAAAKATLEKARADSIGATATLNAARANGAATASIAPLITALNTQAIAQQKLTAAVSGSAAATAAANAANARLAATGAAVAGTSALATATRALGGALALVGGPAGAAILAVGALVYFATRASEAEKILEGLNPELDGLSERFEALGFYQQQLARSELAGNIEEQKNKIAALVEQLDSLRAATERDSQGFFSSYQRDLMVEVLAKIEAAEKSLSGVQSQLASINPPTAQILGFVESISSLNSVLGFFVSGDGVSKQFSLFAEGAGKVKSFSEEYKKLSADIDQQIALVGDEKKSSELAYLARTGQLKKMSADEAALLVERYKALENLEETAEKTKKLNEAEKSRAKSVAASIAELEKQNALYGNQSKYEEVLYDIENGLVKVTKKEKERYLEAAKASDQAKIIGDEWNDTLLLMEQFDNPFDNDWVGKVKKGGDTISNMWERIDETASDAWVAMFDGFDGLMDGIQNVFKRTLAEMAHEALTKPILLNIQQGGIGNIGAGIGSGAGMAAAGVIVGAALISEWNDSMDKKLEELTAEYKQASQSTGTLLAAGNEKSNSINNAISELGDISGDALNVNRAMLGALNDIRDGIGKASAIFGRTGISGPDVGGLGVTTSDTRLGSALGIGTSIGDVGSLVAGVGKVFGGTVGGFIDGVINSVSKAIYSESKSVIDSGIQFTGQTLAEVLAQGAVDALSYATVQTKEKFLGITTKNNASVQTGELDSDLTRQLGLVFGSASDALEQAALSFGLDFNDYIGRLVIDPMQLSLKDLSGDELTAEIDAFFSSTLDVWAKEIITTGEAVNSSVSILDKFQKVGEGAFETVTRLSSQLNTFNSYVDALSLNFDATGFSAVAASQAVADYAGGFDRLGASLSGYYENFFSESERSAQQMQLLTGELNKIGVDAVPATRGAFRELISGLDLTVESEQKQFAALINLQGVFAELVPLTEAMAGASRSLSEIASERYSLETQLLQLNGDTVALRERERELLHESNRTLYDNIKGMEDSIAAAKERYESEQKLAEAAKAASDEIFNLNQQYFDLTATEAEKRNALMQSLLSDEARSIQSNINHWIDARAAAEAAAQAASSAFSSLQQSVSAERARIESIVDSASSAKTVLDSAIDAERSAIDKANQDKISQLQSMADQERKNLEANANAQNQAQEALSKARIDSINQEKSAVEERIGGLKSLFDQLTSAVDDVTPKTNASILAARRSAIFEIDTALRNAASGRGLPTDGRLDTALQSVRENPSELYANAREQAFANDVVRNKLAELAGYTERQLTSEEMTLSILERQLESSQTAADNFVAFTAVSTTKYDDMIAAANAQYANDVAGLDLIAKNAQAQIDKLTGIDSRQLSVEEALTAFNESLLAADFENAQEQYARLDGILEQGQLQLDTLLDIDSGVLSLLDAIDRFAAAVGAVDQTKVNDELIAEMRRTADQLTQLREEQRIQSLAQQTKLNETARNTRILVSNEETV